MFSLIISIIAIALVAALALASIYYGGSAFQEGSADAEASTIVNQGQQIQAAFTMADVAEDDADTLAELSDGTGSQFLKETPSVRGVSWAVVDFGADGSLDVVEVAVNSREVCEAIEDRFDGNEATGSVAALSASNATQAFGCVEESTDTFTAYYSL